MKICSLITAKPGFRFQNNIILDEFTTKFFKAITDFIPNIIFFDFHNCFTVRAFF